MTRKDENKIDFKRLEKLNAKLNISANADKARIAGWIKIGADYDEIMKSADESSGNIVALQPGLGLGYQSKPKKPINQTSIGAVKALSVLERAVKKRNAREIIAKREETANEEEEEEEETKIKVSKKAKSASILDNYKGGKKRRRI